MGKRGPEHQAKKNMRTHPCPRRPRSSPTWTTASSTRNSQGLQREDIVEAAEHPSIGGSNKIRTSNIAVHPRQCLEAGYQTSPVSAHQLPGMALQACMCIIGPGTPLSPWRTCAWWADLQNLTFDCQTKGSTQRASRRRFTQSVSRKGFHAKKAKQIFLSAASGFADDFVVVPSARPTLDVPIASTARARWNIQKVLTSVCVMFRCRKIYDNLRRYEYLGLLHWALPDTHVTGPCPTYQGDRTR